MRKKYNNKKGPNQNNPPKKKPLHDVKVKNKGNMRTSKAEKKSEKRRKRRADVDEREERSGK